MMTKPCNRVERKQRRRERAIERMSASLSSGVRVAYRSHNVIHSPKSHDAMAEVLANTRKHLADDAQRVGLRTKKDRSGRTKFLGAA